MDAEAPRIEFPCDYPIKIIGHSGLCFVEDVVALTRRHAPEIRDSEVRTRDSRAGNYCSVSITIRATGAPQIERLHRELMAHPLVEVVL